MKVVGQVGKKSKRLLSTILTGLIISLLLFSGPTSAINIGLTGIPDIIAVEDDLDFRLNIDIDSEERIPISNITIFIKDSNNSIIRKFAFTPYGEVLYPSSGFFVSMIDDSGLNLRYGYGYGYGYGFNWAGNKDYDYGEADFGYGYGFGSEFGYGNYYYPRDSKLSYELIISVEIIQEFDKGDYYIEAFINTGSEVLEAFVSGTKDFTISEKIPNYYPYVTAYADKIYGSPGLEVYFNASAYDLDGSIVFYEWDFDGDGKYDWDSNSTGNTSYTYLTTGTYRAKIRVTDDRGTPNIDDVIIKVVNPGTRIYVFGSIDRNVTWPYPHVFVVSRDLTVKPGVTLNIEPGVTVRFYSGRELIIDGGLIAEGNSTDKIKFTSHSNYPSKGYWDRIYFREGSHPSSRITHSIIEYSRDGIYTYKSAPAIKYSTIRHNSNYGAKIKGKKVNGVPLHFEFIGNNVTDSYEGLYCYDSLDVNISNNIISDNDFRGIVVDWGLTGEIRDNVISENGKSTNYYYCGIEANYFDGNIFENLIKSNKGSGIHSPYASTKIFSNDILDNYYGIHGKGQITDNLISGNTYGTYISDGNINFNDIYSNSYYDVYCSSYRDINATYNWWGTDDPTQISRHIRDFHDDSSKGEVFFNPILIFENSPGDAEPPNSGSNILTVCNSGCEYSSIQDAVNGAKNGDTVKVLAGIYNENVDINKSINLIGAGDSKTELKSKVNNDHVVDVLANNTNISGIKISGATDWRYAGVRIYEVYNCNISNIFSMNNYNGIFISKSFNNIISNNIARNNYESGIRLSNSINNTLKYNLLEGNTIDDFDFWADYSNLDDYAKKYCSNKIENNIGSGNRPIKFFNHSVILENEVLSELYLCNADNSSIKNITIEGSPFKKNNALHVWWSDGVYYSNVISNENWFGIDLVNSDFNIFNNISTSFNSATGITLSHSHYNLLANISALKNGNRGIQLSSSDHNELAGNNLDRNYIGIQTYDSKSNIIRNNLINQNYKSGINLNNFNPKYSNTFYNNNLNNAQNILFDGSIGENNWDFTDNGYCAPCHGSDKSVHTIHENLLAQGQMSCQTCHMGGSGEFNIPAKRVQDLQVCDLCHFDGDFQLIHGPDWPGASGVNIIGGHYLGGNYWANPSGTGFSQTCSDTNKDGICDSPFILNPQNIDQLPLTKNEVIDIDNITAYWQTSQMIGTDDIGVYPISLTPDGRMDDLIMGIRNDIAAYSDGYLRWKWNFQRKKALGVMDYDGDGVVGDVVIGSNNVYVYKGIESQEYLWNYTLEGIVQALKGVDLDRDGKKDELIVATDEKIYCFDPRSDKIISSFPVGGKINSIDLLEVAGSTSKNVIVGTGRTMIDQGQVLLYSMNGALVSKYNLSGNKAVISVNSIDLDGKGLNDHIMAIFEEKTLNANSLVILNPDLSLNWSKENYAHASPIDFDRDRKLDDIVAIRTTFGLPQIHLINSEGDILKTIKKHEIITRNIPNILLDVSSYSQDSDGIFNDFAMIGKDSADGYYLYGFKDVYDESPGINLPPVANAGRDINAIVGEPVILSAFLSYDPEGKPLSFLWKLGEKLLSGQETFAYIFYEPGIYELNLTVKDGLLFSSDIVVVTVRDEVPGLSIDSSELMPEMSGWVSVKAHNVNNLNTVNFNLTFDPEVVNLNDIKVGEFLGGGSPGTPDPSQDIKIIGVTGHSENFASPEAQIHALILTCQMGQSNPVKYSDIILNYNEGDNFVSGINYSKTIDLSANITDEAITSFIIRRLKDKDPDPNGVLESGEIIEIIYWVQDSSGTDIPIDEGDEFTITLQTKAGKTLVVSKTAPGHIKSEYITDWGVKLFASGDFPVVEEPPGDESPLTKAIIISNIQNSLGWATAMIELPPGVSVNGSGFVAQIHLTATRLEGSSSSLILQPLGGIYLADKDGQEIDPWIKNGNIKILGDEVPPQEEQVIRFSYDLYDLDDDGNKNDYWTHVRNSSQILSTFNGSRIGTSSHREQGKIAYLNMSSRGSGDTGMWYDANKNGLMGDESDYVFYNGLYVFDENTVSPVLDMSDWRIFQKDLSTKRSWMNSQEDTSGSGLGWLGTVFKIKGDYYLLTKEISPYEIEISEASFAYLPDMGCGCSEDHKIPVGNGKLGWMSNNETNSTTVGTIYIYDIEGNTERAIHVDLEGDDTLDMHINARSNAGMIRSNALIGTSFENSKIFLKNATGDGIRVVMGKMDGKKIQNGMENAFGYNKLYMSMGSGVSNPDFSILPDNTFHLMGPSVNLVRGDTVDLTGTEYRMKLDITRSLYLKRERSIDVENGALMKTSHPEYSKFLKESILTRINDQIINIRYNLLDLDDDNNYRDYFMKSQNGSYINGSSIYTTSTGSQGTIVYYGWSPGYYSGIDKSTGLWHDVNDNGKLGESGDYLLYNGFYIIDDTTIQPILRADPDYRIFQMADSTNGSWLKSEDGTFNGGRGWLGAVFKIKGNKFVLTKEVSNYGAEIASAKVVTLSDKGISGNLRDYAATIFGGKMAWEFDSGGSNSTKGTLFILDADGNTEKTIGVDLGSGSTRDVFTNTENKAGMIKSSALSGTSFAGYKIFLKNATSRCIKVIVGKEGEFTLSNNMDNAMGYSKLYMSMGAGRVNPEFSILPDNSFVFMGPPVSLALGGTVDIPDTDYEAELTIDKRFSVKRVKKVSVPSGTKMKTTHPDYGDFLTNDVLVFVEAEQNPPLPKPNYRDMVTKLSLILGVQNLNPGSCFEVVVLDENNENYAVCSGNDYFSVVNGSLVDKDLVLKIRGSSLTQIISSNDSPGEIRTQFFIKKNIGIYANDGVTPLWETSPTYITNLVLKGYKDIYDKIMGSISCPNSLEWLQPLAGDKARNVGSTLPIKFNLTKNNSFYNDTSVNVLVYSPSGGMVFNSTYGNGSDSVRIEDNKYITNFKNGSVSGIYYISVDFRNGCQFSTSFELTNPPIGNPSSGGGGGGAGSNGANGFISKIEKGQSGTMAFSGPSSPTVKGIRITAKKEIYSLGISLKYPSQKPYGTSEIDQEVYKYLEIKKSGPAEDGDIQEAVIEFRIEKGWLEENGIDINTVSLMRFNNGQWDKLDTEVIEDDDDAYVYFQAITPGFSYFAICGLAGSIELTEIDGSFEMPVIPPVVDTKEVEDEVIIEADDLIGEMEEEVDRPQERETSALPLLVPLLLGGLVIGAIYYYQKSKSK